MNRSGGRTWSKCMNAAQRFETAALSLINGGAKGVLSVYHSLLALRFCLSMLCITCNLQASRALANATWPPGHLCLRPSASGGWRCCRLQAGKIRADMQWVRKPNSSAPVSWHVGNTHKQAALRMKQLMLSAALSHLVRRLTQHGTSLLDTTDSAAQHSTSQHSTAPAQHSTRTAQQRNSQQAHQGCPWSSRT